MCAYELTNQHCDQHLFLKIIIFKIYVIWLLFYCRLSWLKNLWMSSCCVTHNNDLLMVYRIANLVLIIYGYDPRSVIIWIHGNEVLFYYFFWFDQQFVSSNVLSMNFLNQQHEINVGFGFIDIIVITDYCTTLMVWLCWASFFLEFELFYWN